MKKLRILLSIAILCLLGIVGWVQHILAGEVLTAFMAGQGVGGVLAFGIVAWLIIDRQITASNTP